MRYLRSFNESNNTSIDSICKKYGIKNYTINSDGSIDVNDSVDLNNFELKEIPLKFRHVSGYFACSDNQLISLEGCPETVHHAFYCSNNQLISLKGCPKEVGGHFNCTFNQLESLEGSPKEVGGYFDCNGNQLESLKGCPNSVGGFFDCTYNKLVTLDVYPEIIGTRFYCMGNPIYMIYNIFNDYEIFLKTLDYNYLRGNCIIKGRFQEALDEVDIEMPRKIEGYKYI